jgi:putative DNA primase/helicase
MTASTRASREAAAKADKYFSEQSERLDRAGAAAGGKSRKGKRGKKEKGNGDGQGLGAGADAARDAPPEPTEIYAPEGLSPAEVKRNAITLLIKGDAGAFIELAAKDVGFPFEAEAMGALIVLKDDPAAFQRLRARLKSETDVSLSAFDDAVHAFKPFRFPGDGGGAAGRAVSYVKIEPWEEPVDGAELLTATAEAIGAYVVMDAHQRDATALWGVFSHAHDFRDYAPILIVVSPMRRCGKSRLQETLARIVSKPQPMVDVTAGLLPRLIENHHPTMLIDEYDALANGDRDMAESLRGLLNSSFNRHGAVVLKLVQVSGGNWEERQFSIWTPSCIAGIGKIPDTVEDRSLIIRLIRKLTSQKVKRLRGKDGGELQVLARKIARWVSDNEHVLKTIEPKELEGLNDRQADAWEPLFAIAEVAGGDWPERARAAATALARDDEAEARERDVGLMLLADIRDGFALSFPAGHLAHKAEGAGRPDDGPRLTTKQLLEWLHAIEERPWVAWGKSKKPINDTGLAKLLKQYRVRSNNVRVAEGVQAKGYYLRSFEDAFTRYLPHPPSQTRPNVPNAGKQGQSEDSADVPNSFWDGSENAGKPSNSGVWDGGTGKNGGMRGERDTEASDAARKVVIEDGEEDR